MPVSGTTVNGLYMSRFTSDNILNGGGFGPEGGLIVTGLIIVSIVLLLLLTRDKKRTVHWQLILSRRQKRSCKNVRTAAILS